MSKKYKKIPVNLTNIRLDTYPVYCKSIYWGHEPFKVVGITKDKIQIQGDFSGIGASLQNDWIKIEELFLVSTVCEEQIKPNGCQIHNVNCCGGGSLITNHVDRYWENIFSEIGQIEKHYGEFWDNVKDLVDEEGWVYTKEAPHLLDTIFENVTEKEIEFQKSFGASGENPYWMNRGSRWRPKSLSEDINKN